MKITRKVIVRIEALLWLVGLCCIGVFSYTKFSAKQATNTAEEK